MSNLKLTKNENSWKLIFEKYHIISEVRKKGQFVISSKEINEFREARLMTKFDHRNNLPNLFKNENLSILPISRGKYIIAGFNAYHTLPQESNVHIEYIEFPVFLESLNHTKIYSESVAVNCAYVSGMLSNFLMEDNLLPTVGGRMGSGEFDFFINNRAGDASFSIDVKNSQIEIDGGFEGAYSLSLIEAKNSFSTDFLVRQLYYPYRLWESRISKQVRPLFLVYSNSIFNLYEYKFMELNNYNSLDLVKHKRYSFEEQDISLQSILKILKERSIVEEPIIPFPQANSFDRVISLCELLHKKHELTTDDITTTYDFDKRQTGYYTNAARYLGLICKKPDTVTSFVLSELGLEVLSYSHQRRQLKYVELILKHSVFAETLKLYLKLAAKPPKEEIVKIMKKSNLYNVRTDGLYFRRASTISGWIDWILSLQK